ncbi:MAG: hypothetical protein ACI90V_003161, partial [Bacillariaceae sp.]
FLVLQNNFLWMFQKNRKVVIMMLLKELNCRKNK